MNEDLFLLLPYQVPAILWGIDLTAFPGETLSLDFFILDVCEYIIRSPNQ